MRWLALVLGLSALAQQPGASTAAAPAQSAAPAPAAATPAEPAQPFDEWLGDLVVEARSRGFTEDLVRETLDGLAPLPRVITRDRSQAELNPGFDRYFSNHVSRALVRRGRELSQAHAALLERIEEKYDVQRRFIVAIWGMESRYGRNTGRTPVFQALATLAWEPRRSEFFRGELFDALSIVARGHIDAPSMTGSWAGAMGQTQFMPSSYLKYAVDFDGNGRRDIWGTTDDALASIANYLKGFGWDDDETWGREVRVPAAARAGIAETVPRRAEGCYAIRNMTERVPLDTWRKLGVTRADGGALPNADVRAGLVDVGERHFLVYPNYDAILGYNCAHYYALTVALLADQLR
jgi:membrane-bound lytic murein transglycosylase B